MRLGFFLERFDRLSLKKQKRYLLLRNFMSISTKMSGYVQFNYLSHNETAKKAMESYVGILQEAFKHYRNLWDDYIKLQEKHEQCNVHPSFKVTDDKAYKETEVELTPQRQLDSHIIMQESDNVPLLELDTLNIDSINFNIEHGSLHPSKSLYKDINSPPKSPVFCKTSVKTNNVSARKIKFSNKAASIYDNLIPDMKTHHSTEEVSLKCQKLGISTAQHVETTFLPSGKRLKQSRLVFHPIKYNENMVSSNTDKHKPVSVLREQDVIEDISVAKTSATAESDATNNESFEDVIEISPTQRDVKPKVRHRLKLKRNICAIQTIESSNKNKCHRPSLDAVPEITINDIDFALCPSPEHNPTQIKDDESLVKDSNTAIDALKEKVSINNFLSVKMYNKTDVQTAKLIESQNKNQLIIKKENITQNVNDLCEDETFYLPAEQIAHRNDTDDFNLDNTENRPPAKKMLLDKLNVVPERKRDVSEQLNMRCKVDRAKLDGWDCWECKQYYKNLSLSKEELQKRKNQCSRHRYKYERPNTPEGFWDPEFPETLSSTYRQNIN